MTNYNVPQLYLEMARAVFTGVRHPEKKTLEQICDEDGLDPLLGIQFAMISVTILYSYLAIEAFVNAYLYEIWDQSRIIHMTVEDLRQKNHKLSESFKPRYDDFYQKYGKIEPFEKLKQEKELRDLAERIKLVCKEFNIRQIYEVDNGLWQEFKGLLEKVRHYFTHPYPDPTKFDEMMKTILLEQKGGKYLQISQDIIKHFFVETKRDIPKWVEENLLFTIKGFEYLYKKDNSKESQA